VFEQIASDVRFACRWLRRSPGFATLAIGSLAIGIGFNAALFTVVDALLFRPLPVERPEQLVDVYTTGSDGDAYATSSYPDYLDYRSRNDVFSDMLAFSPSLDAVKVGARSRLALGQVVSGTYFQLLGVRALVGRTLTPEDDRAGAPRAAVISYALWRRDYGGSAAALGQSIRVRGQVYTIVGVAPAQFTGTVPLIAPE
jgi:putative ABC transport system permease protein